MSDGYTSLSDRIVKYEYALALGLPNFRWCLPGDGFPNYLVIVVLFLFFIACITGSEKYATAGHAFTSVERYHSNPRMSPSNRLRRKRARSRANSPCTCRHWSTAAADSHPLRSHSSCPWNRPHTCTCSCPGPCWCKSRRSCTVDGACNNWGLRSRKGT